MKIPLAQAIEILKNGGVVAVPTETVYGLAARVQDAQAVQKIFVLKGRPADNPLIVHISKLTQLSELVRAVPSQLSKLKKFWPGPLTVVMSAQKQKIPSIVRARLATVAIRLPDHPLMCALIDQVGPLAAPSANRSGFPSPTCRQHVEADLGKDFPVLDGGACRKGVESTVIALTPRGWQLLRAGALAGEKITQALGQPQLTLKKSGAKPRSPGQKYRHYAPQARLVLCRTRAQLKKSLASAHAVLGFADSPHGKLPLISLGQRDRAAANLKRLYRALRALDQHGYKKVLIDGVFCITDLGATLHERLSKAASR